jgi:hypothetical protein
MNTTTETEHPNAHRFSVVEPGEYRHVGEFYQGPSEEMQSAFSGEHRHLAEAGVEFGVIGDPGNVEFHRNGGCAHCGSHFFYGSVFRHDGEFVALGHVCAGKFMTFDTNIELRAARAKATGKRMADRVKMAEKWVEVVLADDKLCAALHVDHRIINDIARRGAEYGDISEKQFALILKIAAEEAEKAETPEAEEAPKVPVPVTDERVEIEGVIVSHKWVAGFGYEDVHKMLVEVTTDDGTYRLWGSYPNALYGVDADRGDRVRFVARIERSNNDESFGFFKRPTKVERLVEVTA